MDLVFTIDTTEVLVDVTTIDANNPSNGFSRGTGLTSAYYPGAASVIAARRKWDRYRFLLEGPSAAATGSLCLRGTKQVGPLRSPIL